MTTTSGAAAATASATAAAPDVVVNCAAWTDVDGAEAAEEARDGASTARALAVAARNAGALCVHVSSDYVFDGASPGGYVEEDATRE